MGRLSLFVNSILIVFAACSSSFAAQGGDPIAKLRSTNKDIQKEGVSELKEERRKLIAGLIDILKAGDQDPKSKQSSTLISTMEVIGEMRAVESVSVLMEYFSYMDLSVGHSFVTPAKRFPAVGALVKIGEPSLSEVMKIIKNSEPGNAVINMNCGWIILQILGKKVGIYYLQNAMEVETDIKKKERISEFIKSF